MGLALRPETSQQFRLALLGIAVIVVLGLLAGHLVGENAVRRLGTRISHLEKHLGFDEFPTTVPLEYALRATKWGAAVILLVVLLLFASTLVGGA